MNRNICVQSKLLLAVVLWVFSCSAISAGKADRYNVVSVRTDQNGKGLVIFANDLVGSPASCISNGFLRHLAFDANTPGGRAILSLAMFAQGAGKKIFAMGTGDCSVYGIVETWNYGWTLE